MRYVGRQLLGCVCVVMLVGFHLINLHEGRFLGPVKQWVGELTTSRIALTSTSGELFGFKFLALSETKPTIDKPSAPKPRKERKSRRRRKPRPKPKPDQADRAETKPASPAPSKPVKAEPPAPKLDPATQWLSWVGLNLRAKVDQSQQRWINYRYRGRRYYFLRDEIALQYAREKPIVRTAFNQITQLVNRAVTAGGGTLIIAPMPTKTSIYRDRLPAWLPEQQLWAPVEPYDKTNVAYDVYAEARSGAPTESIDVFKAFADYHQRHGKEDLYIPSNHQWSSLGIAITSQEVIANLRARGWDLAKPQLVKLDEPGELYDSGLLALLNLPPEFGRFYPQTQRHEAVYGVNQVAKRSSAGRLIVLGTCFSNRLRGSNGFTETLSRSLRRPNAINLSAEGGKTLPSFANFRRRYKRFQPDDLVVWEFNVRETFTAEDIQKIKRAISYGPTRRPKGRKRHKRGT